MESTWDLMTAENQHCLCREKHHHKQVCFKMTPESNSVSCFSESEMPLWVPVLRDYDILEVGCLEASVRNNVGCKNMFPPGDRTRGQWWPEGRGYLKDCFKGYV